jgi:hypothetical protein
MSSPSCTQDVGSASPHPEPTLELPADLPVPDPYTKGASFESFEAAKDALLRHTVARGLSYKVLRGDKTRSRYLVSCLSSSCLSIPAPIRPKCLRRRHDNGRSTAQLPSGDPFELAAGKVGQIPAVSPPRPVPRGSHPEAARDHGPRAVQRESLLIQTGMAHPWRTLGAARAEAVGGEAEWVDPCRHGDVESPPPLPQELQEQVDAFRAAEPEPAPDPESWKRQQEEGERRRREEARFAQRYEDGREILLGAYAREHHGIPRLEDDRGEGLGSFINRLLPARDRVRFAEDGDDERESAGAVSEG